jgi:hypothetical protein
MLDDKNPYHPRRFEELAADPVPPSLINEVVQEDVRELLTRLEVGVHVPRDQQREVVREL